MPEATDRPARWVQSDADVAELAALVLDPAREGLIIGVTMQPQRERPLVDADALAARLGDRADVWVVTAAQDAWQLTEALPPGLDVYGGAVRAWWPLHGQRNPAPSEHPQWTVFEEHDGPRVADQIVAYVEMGENPPPTPGSEATATVTKAFKAGAELRLETGHDAFAANAHLVHSGEVFHAKEILQPGQEVTVRVGPWHPQAGRVSVSLREWAPDPWDRLAEVYEPGAIIDGVVSRIQPYGAFVELLPGAEGLLHKSKIADAFVEYVEDFVRVGDRIPLRLISVDPYEHKAEISLVDVPAGATPLPPASVYPGGPPWLPEGPGFEEDPPRDSPSGDEAQPSREASPASQQPTDRDATHPTAARAVAALVDQGFPAIDQSDEHEIVVLQSHIADLEQRLQAAEQERDELRAKLEQLA